MNSPRWSMASSTYNNLKRSGRTHGIRSTYVHGCRCDACREAEREYRRTYRARRSVAA